MDDYRYEFDWFTSKIPVWIEYMGGYAGKKDLCFIEIGSWEGRSTSWILERLLTEPSCVLHSVDPRDSPNGSVIEATFDHNMRIACARTPARLIKYRGTSNDLLPTFPQESVDVIHVDGCHLAHYVLLDLVLSWRLLKVGGVLFCDDYELEDGIIFHDDGQISYHSVPPIERPKMAIDAFMACFADKLELLHKGDVVLLKKKQGLY